MQLKGNISGFDLKFFIHFDSESFIDCAKMLYIKYKNIFPSEYNICFFFLFQGNPGMDGSKGEMGHPGEAVSRQ